MGGTFMSLPSDYRDYFIRNLHDALSGNSSSCVKEVCVSGFGWGGGGVPLAVVNFRVTREKRAAADGADLGQHGGLHLVA